MVPGADQGVEQGTYAAQNVLEGIAPRQNRPAGQGNFYDYSTPDLIASRRGDLRYGRRIGGFGGIYLPGGLPDV